MRIDVIDVETWPDGALGVRAGDGYRYRSLVVRCGGRPRGVLCAPAQDVSAITRAELERCVQRGPAPCEPPLLDGGLLPSITVVVCTTFGRSDTLLECLASLERLDGRPSEILVVDNRPRSDARARTLVEGIRAARLIHEPRPGLAAARNRALQAAGGEIVAFTDDDVVVDPLWLRAIATRLRTHPEEVGACGLVLPRRLETAAQVRLETYRGGFGPRSMSAVTHRLVRRPGLIGVRAPRVSATDGAGEAVRTFPLYEVGRLGVGANMAFRAASLREAGGFDERLGAGTPACGGEDIELFVRLIWGGAALGFEPAAIVLHEHRRTDAELQAQMRQYGVGFTATLTALACTDPRHLLAMAATAPAGGRRKLGDSSAEATKLRRLEFRGRLRGPDAFLRSWLHSHARS